MSILALVCLIVLAMAAITLLVTVLRDPSEGPDLSSETCLMVLALLVGGTFCLRYQMAKSETPVVSLETRQEIRLANKATYASEKRQSALEAAKKAKEREDRRQEFLAERAANRAALEARREEAKKAGAAQAKESRDKLEAMRAKQ